jgi:hypothetical protein
MNLIRKPIDGIELQLSNEDGGCSLQQFTCVEVSDQTQA